MTALMNLALAITACGLTWWGLGVATSLAGPWLLRHLERLGPTDRSWCVLGLALLPFVLAVTVTAFVFIPPLSAIAVSEHCHAGACGAHIPFVDGPGAVLLVLSLLAVAGFAVCLFVTVLALWRSIRLTRTFAALSRPGSDGLFSILDSDSLIACCVGLFAPHVIVSRGLAARADPEQLRIVLMHEYAHAYRFDNLRKLLAGLATLPWLRVPRTRVLDALHGAAEQSCDAFVARRTGDPHRVANTIRSISNWRDGAGGAVDRVAHGRIERLLQSNREHDRRPWIYAGAVPLAVIMVATAAPAVHFFSEAILRLL